MVKTMDGLLTVLGVLEVRERLTKLTPCLDEEREWLVCT